jgi:hypothetical protein
MATSKEFARRRLPPLAILRRSGRHRLLPSMRAFNALLGIPLVGPAFFCSFPAHAGCSRLVGQCSCIRSAVPWCAGCVAVIIGVVGFRGLSLVWRSPNCGRGPGLVGYRCTNRNRNMRPSTTTPTRQLQMYRYVGTWRSRCLVHGRQRREHAEGAGISASLNVVL